MGMKHNCTKEGKFEFIEVHVLETDSSTDKIKCLICGRVWEEYKERFT